MGPWSEWFKQAVEPEMEDPFVDLLRTAVAEGARVVRVNIGSPETAVFPLYVVTLIRSGALFEHRIPHSRSFTRWSLALKVRLDTVEEEETRFRALLDEHFVPLNSEWGTTYFRSLLVSHLRVLGPPRTVLVLSGHHEYEPNKGDQWAKAVARVNTILRELARALVHQLGYEHEVAARILDGALTRVVDRLFHVSARRDIFG